MTWTPPTSPTAAPSTPASIVSWIRNHKVISTIVGVFIGIMILGGISNVAHSYKTATVYTNTRYGPQSPTPQQSAEQQQIAQAQAQTHWMQQQQAAQRQANDNQFEQGLGYAGSQG
jgi:uncharacterized iron-regulated membrane protein